MQVMPHICSEPGLFMMQFLDICFILFNFDDL